MERGKQVKSDAKTKLKNNKPWECKECLDKNPEIKITILVLEEAYDNEKICNKKTAGKNWIGFKTALPHRLLVKLEFITSFAPSCPLDASSGLNNYALVNFKLQMKAIGLKKKI